MEHKNFNGFASEEQYEAAMNIIKNAIDEYTDTIAIELKTNSVEKYVVVMVETKELNHFAKYFVNDNGVFYVNLESENMPIVECKIFAALNECADDVFDKLWKFAGRDRLNKLLNGDTSVVTYEQYSNDAENDTKKLNDIMSKNNIVVDKDLIENLSGYISLVYWECVPVIEQHYGVKLNRQGNKYYYFDKVA